MITVLSFPVDRLGFPSVARLDNVTIIDGPAGWRWEGRQPALAVTVVDVPTDAVEVPGWGVDHVAITASNFEGTLDLLAEAGGDVRRIGETRRGQRAGFVLAGLLVEVIDAPRDALAGVAFETDEPLEEVAARWQASGLDVRGPHDAVQKGRKILSTGRVAVMTRRV